MSQRYSSSFCSSWVVPSQIPSPTTTTTITSSNSSCFSSPPNLPRDSNTPPPAPKKGSIVCSKPTQQHRYTRVYPPSWTVTSLFPPTPVSPPSTQTYRPQSNYNQPSTTATPTPTATNNITSSSPAAIQIRYFQHDMITSRQNSCVADAPAKQPAGYGAHDYSASMCITTTLPISTYPYPPRPPMTRTAPWKAPGGYAYPETCGGYTPQPTSPFSGAADQPAHAPQVAPSYSPPCRI
ncbi:hypothetical protein BDD12DRAFT_833458 [Trichophaea hybrida]|nr:hypothetical protein BDD12DRAFT_833458 [Trichophaea hybrida]